MQDVLKTFQTYLESLGKYEKGDRSPLEQLGGITGFKEKLAGWLKDDDQAIRAFAAIMLGVVGDKSYAPQLVDSLKAGKYKGDNLLHYDKGRIAIALGVMGAAEYTANLVALLSSPDEYDRAGAAYGLGFLKAKDQVKVVAKLLKDEDEDVRQAAKEALDMIGASEVKKDKRARKPR